MAVPDRQPPGKGLPLCHPGERPWTPWRPTRSPSPSHIKEPTRGMGRTTPQQVARPADRLWFAALCSLIPRRCWAKVFPVTPSTLLVWHRRLAPADGASPNDATVSTRRTAAGAARCGPAIALGPRPGRPAASPTAAADVCTGGTPATATTSASGTCRLVAAAVRKRRGHLSEVGTRAGGIGGGRRAVHGAVVA